MTTHKGLIRFSSRDTVQGVPYVKEGINLCMLPNGLRCMGCCGFDFAKNLSDDAKESFIIALQKSTKELARFQDRLSFKKRVDPEDLHDCGMCKQLVMEETQDIKQLLKKKHLKTYCPLHPLQNDGKELRKGECDPSFMCETQKAWHTFFDDTMKELFYEFITEKDLDWFTYSRNMHNSSLLKEFYKEYEMGNVYF